MSRLDLNKIKKNFPEMEKMTHRYLVEILTAVSVVVGWLSASGHWFVGSLVWSVLFLVIGALAGLFFPVHIDHAMKNVYFFSSGRNQVYTIGAEAVKIAVALFLPFLYFGFLGLLAGTAYQYYIHHSRSHHE